MDWLRALPAKRVKRNGSSLSVLSLVDSYLTYDINLNMIQSWQTLDDS